MTLEDFKKLKPEDSVIVYDTLFIKYGKVIGFMDGTSSAYIETGEKVAGKRAYGWFSIFTPDRKGLCSLSNEIEDDISTLENTLNEVNEML